MATSVLFFAWNRPIPGREKLSQQHFGDFVQYLDGLQRAAKVESYDIVFLNQHGGDLNGFFLIKGEAARLGEVAASDEWVVHMTRAAFHLEGSGCVMGVTGAAIPERMKLWSSLIPG